MTDTFAIRLPWPEAPLHPNARVGRRQVIAAERRARVAAFRAAEEQITLPSSQAHLRLIFYPPDRRRRDMTNMVAATKSYLDGIVAAAGVAPSDWSYLIQRGQVVFRGCVIIRITNERPPPT